jgi:hypothetical protein
VQKALQAATADAVSFVEKVAHQYASLKKAKTRGAPKGLGGRAMRNEDIVELTPAAMAIAASWPGQS